MDAQCHQRTAGTETSAENGLGVRLASLPRPFFGTASAPAPFASVDGLRWSLAMDYVGAQRR
jgi:hypothetical protein